MAKNLHRNGLLARAVGSPDGFRGRVSQVRILPGPPFFTVLATLVIPRRPSPLRKRTLQSAIASKREKRGWGSVCPAPSTFRPWALVVVHLRHGFGVEADGVGGYPEDSCEPDLPADLR